MTYEEIMQRMLDRVPSTIDKREGSIIFDALAPAAIELIQLYENMNWAIQQAFVDTASRDYLILKAKERGIEPTPKTSSVISASYTPTNLTIPIGSRFNLGELNFRVTELIGAGQLKLVCETAGTQGNISEGALIPIDYINGLQASTVTGLLIAGEDDEDTEAFRNRLLDTYSIYAFGGNQADYRAKANELQGVGGVKVIPHWNGGGTVKIVFVSSSYDVPSAVLVDAIQDEIDPITGAGAGLGIAPIGHVVTVEGATALAIDVSASVALSEGFSFADVQANIYAALDSYFIGLAETWQDMENVIVRNAAIQTAILGVDKVIDIDNVTINGQTSNIVVPSNQVPKRGAFNAIA